MLIGPREIQSLIPHTGDMCLLNSVIHWNSTSIACTATSHRNSDNPLARNGRVSSLCGIEFAAQAMAVHGGLTGLVEHRPRAGVLVSVRDVITRVKYLSDQAADLQVSAHQLLAGEHAVTYSFSINAGEVELLSGRATVVLDADKLNVEKH